MDIIEANVSVKGNLEIYPNPSNTIIRLKSFHRLKNQELNVYDIEGKLVKQIQIEDPNKVDISSLKAGNYFFRIKLEDGKNVSAVFEKN